MQLSIEHPLFVKALPILNHIKSHDYEAFFVGGCVRDLLLDRPINDIDIATSAFPEEIMQIFPHTFDVGIQHGTVGVLYQDELYEVTTFRTEDEYSDHRRPDSVTFVRSLEEDTLRRDFTINALAMDDQGVIFDYHGGIHDLDLQVIRCVRAPMDRFHEDSLRMMRAIRFASQLGFVIDGETLEAIRLLSSDLNYVAIERVRVEFMKFLEGDYFAQCTQLPSDSGLADYILGLSKESASIILPKIAQDLAPLHEIPSELRSDLIWSRLCYYLDYNQEQTTKYLRKWKHSNDFIRTVQEISILLDAYYSKQITRELLYVHSESVIELIDSYLMAHQCINYPSYSQLKSQLPISQRSDIQTNGQKIMSWLQMTKGGPIIGHIFEDIESKILNEELINREEEIASYVQDKYL